jgi:hypothetical protein
LEIKDIEYLNGRRNGPPVAITRDMKSIAVILAMVASIPPAFAQSPGVSASSIDLQTAKPTEGPKSIATATQLAVAGSLLGPVIAGVGFFASDTTNADLVAVGLGVSILAPSAGHWYANELGSGPMAVRAAGGAIVGAGALYYSFGKFCDSCFNNKDKNDQTATNIKSDGEAIMIAGVAIVVAGSIYDIATTGDAVTRYNQKHSVLSSMTVAPMIQPATSSRGTVTGVSMSGAF